MPAMNISITPELLKIVQDKVASGRYNNASEVIREAIRNMEVNEQLLYELKLERLKQKLAPSLEEIERGEFYEFSIDSLIDEPQVEMAQ